MLYCLTVRFRSFLFLLIFLFVITAGISLFVPKNLQAPQVITITPTIIPTTTILGTSVSNSKCHALHIDLSNSEAFLPDPECTPGVIDTAVTQENLYTTICLKGYTKTVRPSVSYTNKLKKQQIIDYGYIDTNMSNYEEDHFISLELGGSPTDPKNLWPEPGPSFNEKDKVENYLHNEVCSKRMTLLEAQEKITKNWYEVYLQINQ